MILPPRIRARNRMLRQRINRAPSPIIAVGLPWLSIILGSMLSTVLVIASAPIMPPLGFLTFLAWRQLRPGLLPIWAGLPLGLVDVKVCAIDADWSALKLVWRKEHRAKMHPAPVR